MSKAESNIYNTLYTRPTLELVGYATRHRLSGNLMAYLNFGGATGSAKDALAEGMLALAMEQGKLKRGQPVIEASGGTFAVALTVAGLHSGHPVHLVMQGNVAPERVKMFEELGATVALTNYVYGRSGVLRKVEEICSETGGYFVNYFGNDNNPEFHRRVTGPAVLEASGGDLDVLVAGVGSGGTITGVGEYLKGWAGKVHVVAVQPFESQSLTGGYSGRHGISGLGPGFVPDNYNPYVVDEVMSVTTGDAKTAARELLLTDAVPASVSCGAVVCAARQVLQTNPGRVMCIFNGMNVLE